MNYTATISSTATEPIIASEALPVVHEIKVVQSGEMYAVITPEGVATFDWPRITELAASADKTMEVAPLRLLLAAREAGKKEAK